jgi:hypothetical protein
MTRMTLNARVGPDGVLRLNVPVGPQEADQDVQVTVEPIAPKKPMTQAEWAAWVQSMAGSWQGAFERPPQGELQERDPL